MSPLQKSESEAQIVNVYVANSRGRPLKSQVQDHSVLPSVEVITL